VTVEGTGQEISCVSCHNPHGSQNPALLKVGGGPMGICLDCHQK
jgi:predicted CXXCH cytochrome family protein